MELLRQEPEGEEAYLQILPDLQLQELPLAGDVEMLDISSAELMQQLSMNPSQMQA